VAVVERFAEHAEAQVVGRSRTHAFFAYVVRGRGVAVIARVAVWLDGNDTLAGGVDAATEVTRVGSGANHSVAQAEGADALTGCAHVFDRAGAAVVAGGAVGSLGTGAFARFRVALAGLVTIVKRRAVDGEAQIEDAFAHALAADVADGGGAPVVARGAVGLRRIEAKAGGGVAGALHVTVVGGRAVYGKAQVPRPAAVAGRANVIDRRGVAVIARNAVGLGGMRTAPRRRVATPRVVALIERPTFHPETIIPRSSAGARNAHVVERDRVVVVAGRPIGFGCIRTSAGRGVTHARLVAVIERGTPYAGTKIDAVLGRSRNDAHADERYGK
jgi:hypothetical protein